MTLLVDRMHVYIANLWGAGSTSTGHGKGPLKIRGALAVSADYMFLVTMRSQTNASLQANRHEIRKIRGKGRAVYPEYTTYVITL